jgi:hypothetical protein
METLIYNFTLVLCQTLLFFRVLSGSSPYVVAINLGGEKEAVKLDGPDIPENLAVDVASINSERKIG